jgi:putative ABC transport system permease protein
MYLLKLALQKLSVQSTFFSVLLFAIGISIISLIVLADKNLNQSIKRNFSGIDLVVGAKGSPTQLILSSVLHADYPTGNINLAEAENLARNPLVRQAIPLALGDSYRGYRIVGAPLVYAELYNAELQKGNWYEKVLEVTIGANVALGTGLKVGDQFSGVHGFQESGHAHADHLYTVAGILRPGAGVVDNLILTPVASVWKVHDDHHDHNDDHDHSNAESESENQETSSDPTYNHDHHDHDESDEHDHSHHANDEQQHSASDLAETDPVIASILKKIEADEDISLEEMQLYQVYQLENLSPSEIDTREITAMLIQFRSPAGIIQLTRLINENTNMQAASPALEINRLLRLLSVGFNVFMTLAWIIIAISGINIFIHLWNTLQHGMHDIALMRVLGASPFMVFMMLIYQGTFIATLGWMAGIVMSRAIWLLLPSFHFLTETQFYTLYNQELLLLVFAVLTGILASLIPAWMAYKTDVHFTLTRN